MKRYRCIELGHNLKTIQATLDALPDNSQLISCIVAGICVMGIVENREPPWPPPEIPLEPLKSKNKK